MTPQSQVQGSYTILISSPGILYDYLKTRDLMTLLSQVRGSDSNISLPGISPYYLKSLDLTLLSQAQGSHHTISSPRISQDYLKSGDLTTTISSPGISPYYLTSRDLNPTISSPEDMTLLSQVLVSHPYHLRSRGVTPNYFKSGDLIPTISSPGISPYYLTSRDLTIPSQVLGSHQTISSPGILY